MSGLCQSVARTHTVHIARCVVMPVADIVRVCRDITVHTQPTVPGGSR